MTFIHFDRGAKYWSVLDLVCGGCHGNSWVTAVYQEGTATRKTIDTVHCQECARTFDRTRLIPRLDLAQVPMLDYANQEAR